MDHKLEGYNGYTLMKYYGIRGISVWLWVQYGTWISGVYWVWSYELSENMEHGLVGYIGYENEN